MIKIMNKFLNKETLMYAIVGCFTTILNVLLFKALVELDWNYKLANIVTIITVKITAYVCNKNIVFKSHCESLVALIREMIRFIVYRGLSALIDYFGLIFAVEILKGDKIISKIIVSVAVITINYLTGKKAVFLDSGK